VASSCSGNPYNGHTLRDVIDHTQKLTGREIERGYVDKGYRGHDTQAGPAPRLLLRPKARRLWHLQERTGRQSAIGHLKADGHLGRCHLKRRAGDAANAILSAEGHNFRRTLAWLRALLRLFLSAIMRGYIIRSALNPAH
jgi:IS5 family transposase